MQRSNGSIEIIPGVMAIPEGRRTRRDFLAISGALATLAVVGCSDNNNGPSGTAVVTLPLQNDTDILKFALFLELLESDFYTKAVAGGTLTGGVATLATNVRDHENAHVAALQAALGSAKFTAADVGFDFKDSLSTQDKFLATAVTLEQTGVSAYLGALPSITGCDLRTTAGSIYTIEGRHVAAFRAYANAQGGPVPAAFETPQTPEEVVAAVTSTGFVTKGLG
ncbi:MAG TPA: ferritin-like domain-containing protein [Gemmatimonadales bacterium]|nr:ferritin-like domain-containing protein [Gemmatimonadales bacterium]